MPGVSDHSLIISIPRVNFGRKLLKFFNFWVKHSDYMDLVSEV